MLLTFCVGYQLGMKQIPLPESIVAMLIGPNFVQSFIFFFVLFGFSDKVCLMIGLYDKVDPAITPSIDNEPKKYDKINNTILLSTESSSQLSPMNASSNEY